MTHSIYSINYSFADTPFGSVIIASTSLGICYIAFSENENLAFDELMKKFPKAEFVSRTSEIHKEVITIILENLFNLSSIKLHLIGTSFQQKVWNELLKTSIGELVTYREIAQRIGNPKASRAVGSAVAKNPVALLVPCHRVVLSGGNTGNYHWGRNRKIAIIDWERKLVTPPP